MARVVWAETALRDLESIAEYIEIEDPDAAKRVVQRAFDKTDQLQDFTASGSKPRGLNGTPYRRLISKLLLIYYRIEGDIAFIVHVAKRERKFDLSRIERSE